jgi:hypothetical protein
MITAEDSGILMDLQNSPAVKEISTHITLEHNNAVVKDIFWIVRGVGLNVTGEWFTSLLCVLETQLQF